MAADVFFDALEREQLANLLDELGPDAPTLLDPWTTRDLAAHLVLRESDMVAAPGILIPGPWGRFADQRREALTRHDFPRLVATIRSGPPRGLFRVKWLRQLINLNEFYVHHEDVRRANGLAARVNSPDMDMALWRNVTRSRWVMSRRLRGAGLELEWTGTGTVIRARRGAPVARLVGLPGELVLYLFGRRQVAQVEVRGPAAAVDAVARADFGI